MKGYFQSSLFNSNQTGILRKRGTCCTDSISSCLSIRTQDHSISMVSSVFCTRKGFKIGSRMEQADCMSVTLAAPAKGMNIRLAQTYSHKRPKRNYQKLEFCRCGRCEIWLAEHPSGATAFERVCQHLLLLLAYRSSNCK